MTEGLRGLIGGGMTIGKLRLTPRGDKFWLEWEDGEGMEISAESLERLLKQFMADNF